MIPDIRVLGDRRFVVAEKFPHVWCSHGVMHRITVPKGFICDGNSVPWFARVFIPGDWTLGLIAVLIHDLLYFYKGRLPFAMHQIWVNGNWTDALQQPDTTRLTWKREDADKLFAVIMREDGVPMWRRRMAYRGVRAAVWQNWDESPWSEHD